MTSPKYISLVHIATADYEGAETPQPFAVVGDAVAVEAQEEPTIDATPADAAAVATDLQAVVDALIAAGVFTAA